MDEIVFYDALELLDLIGEGAWAWAGTKGEGGEEETGRQKGKNE